MDDDMNTRTAEEREQSQERTWAMLCHLSALSGLVGVPMGQLIGPVIVWLVKKDEYETVDRHGRNVINFQLSVTLYSLAALVLVAALFGLTWLGPGNEDLNLIVPLIAIAATLGLFWAISLICTVLAAIQAYNGDWFRYPFAIRFLR
jgi:uncharacterized Tic20 family protein